LTMHLKLPHYLRKRLKEPLGILLEQIPEKSIEKIVALIQKYKPLKIITVGDIVTQYLLMNSIYPDISVIDERSFRRKIIFPYPYFKFYNVYVEVSNPPGTITRELWCTIKKFLKLPVKTLIKVNGEEDLAVLPLIIEAYERSLVLYGQPGVGVVAILVNRDSKESAKEILMKFEGDLHRVSEC